MYDCVCPVFTQYILSYNLRTIKGVQQIITQPHFCTCPKSGYEFPTSHVMWSFLWSMILSDRKVISGVCGISGNC